MMNSVYRKQIEKDYDQLNIATFISGENSGEKYMENDCGEIFCSEKLKGFWADTVKTLDFGNAPCTETLGDGSELFIEQISKNPKLIILGGGHISLVLCKICSLLDFSITVVDDREEFANIKRFDTADEVLCMNFDDAFKQISPQKNNYYVIVTRGHKDDEKCLDNVLERERAYVGMIGSKSKVAYSMNVMKQKGYSEEELKSVYTPIGLKIDAQTPEEIAVSIAAELIQVRRTRGIGELSAKIAKAAADNEKQYVMATIVEKKGSAPRDAGTKMMIDKTGGIVGTIGGGSVENAVVMDAVGMFKSGKSSKVMKYDLSVNDSSNLGMVCGGTVRVLFEMLGE